MRSIFIPTSLAWAAILLFCMNHAEDSSDALVDDKLADAPITLQHAKNADLENTTLAHTLFSVSQSQPRSASSASLASHFRPQPVHALQFRTRSGARPTLPYAGFLVRDAGHPNMYVRHRPALAVAETMARSHFGVAVPSAEISFRRSVRPASAADAQQIADLVNSDYTTHAEIVSAADIERVISYESSSKDGGGKAQFLVAEEEETSQDASMNSEGAFRLVGCLHVTLPREAEASDSTQGDGPALEAEIGLPVVTSEPGHKNVGSMLISEAERFLEQAARLKLASIAWRTFWKKLKSWRKVQEDQRVQTQSMPDSAKKERRESFFFAKQRRGHGSRQRKPFQPRELWARWRPRMVSRRPRKQDLRILVPPIDERSDLYAFYLRHGYRCLPHHHGDSTPDDDPSVWKIPQSLTNEALGLYATRWQRFYKDVAVGTPLGAKLSSLSEIPTSAISFTTALISISAFSGLILLVALPCRSSELSKGASSTVYIEQFLPVAGASDASPRRWRNGAYP